MIGMVCRYLYENNKDNLEDILRGTVHYSRLVELGFEKDRILSKDEYSSCVAVYRDGVIGILKICVTKFADLWVKYP